MASRWQCVVCLHNRGAQRSSADLPLPCPGREYDMVISDSNDPHSTPSTFMRRPGAADRCPKYNERQLDYRPQWLSKVVGLERGAFETTPSLTHSLQPGKGIPS